MQIPPGCHQPCRLVINFSGLAQHLRSTCGSCSRSCLPEVYQENSSMQQIHQHLQHCQPGRLEVIIACNEERESHSKVVGIVHALWTFLQPWSCGGDRTPSQMGGWVGTVYKYLYLHWVQGSYCDRNWCGQACILLCLHWLQRFRFVYIYISSGLLWQPCPHNSFNQCLICLQQTDCHSAIALAPAVCPVIWTYRIYLILVDLCTP